uniref:Uncharacterized protein n=1 Tax=Candidatus Kentrum sp. LPFa TaxID=2126335 RepID=A0A450X411_9GAMM|nr:MAG: hypothetical protein BECKLPF1236B_GA0070989_13912 [Candidatus Kentron sp. LPFa]
MALRLSKEIASFKSYTAHYLIEYLKQQNARRVLEQLHFFKKRHKNDREHQVWEEGCHPEEIQGDAMMLRKIDYVYNNLLATIPWSGAMWSKLSTGVTPARGII